MSSWRSPIAWRDHLLLAGVMFGACIAGILSRPSGFIAVLWPANALLLGLLLRNRAWARRPSYGLVAFFAFVAADLVTGSNALVAFGFNAANLVGVLAGWLYLRRQGASTLGFRRQHSVLYLLVGSAVAALGSAVPGALVSVQVFGSDVGSTLQRWFSGELFDMVLVLPVVLTAPRGWIWRWDFRALRQPLADVPRLPLVAVLVAIVMVFLLKGPGAVGYLVPALVWCALSYGIFGTAVLNLVACTAATALLLAGGAVGFGQVQVHEAISFQSGIALISLAPLTVAVAQDLRAQILGKLRFAANHDDLTGALSRRALMERGTRLLQRFAREGANVAVLIADLDHFKRINDHFGHARGDAVLRHFGALVLRNLRPQDLFGRVGGEEFVLVLPNTSLSHALAVAERIRGELREQSFGSRNGQTLQATVSLGVSAAEPADAGTTLAGLLAQADVALYRAKAEGRDRVCSQTPEAA